MITEVASTLALLHDAGFVHGDLKPAHVRVAGGNRAPRAILLDLGAAVHRARDASAPRAYTRAFAAPEVIAGGAPSPRADLFGLGTLARAIAVALGSPRPRGPSPVRGPSGLPDWVPPSIASLIGDLLADHPSDRPADAREVLRRLGAAGIAAGHPPPPIGRDRELERLLSPSAAPVRFITGPIGVGKSHLARELVTRALLAGQSCRLLRFGGHDRGDDAALTARLVAFFRGSDRAIPFLGADAGDRSILLVLDDLHLAPAELVAALDLYRCRADPARPLEVIATARAAPDGAEAIDLGPLDDASFPLLAIALGITDPARIEEARTASGGIPGFVAAAAGRVPLTRDLALDRQKCLSSAAAELLAAIAVLGGEVPDALCRRLLGAGPGSDAETPAPIGELLGAALVTRSSAGGSLFYALSAPALAPDLAMALASPDLVNRLAEALLADPRSPAAALLAVASAPIPAARRVPLLERAAVSARAEERRSLEIDALFALASIPEARSAARLGRLERLSRDSGAAAIHPRVLAWLDEAAREDPSLLVLSLRRRAEQRARAGDAAGASALAEQARRAAIRAGDPAGEALALATIGAAALYRAEWGEADRAIAEARARLSALDVGRDDPEEVARVDHNVGVIALYRGLHDEAAVAFDRSLAAKRNLGDRAGMRSCLLNLGLALAKLGRLDEADRALDEGLQIARSLGQTAGRGWCLAARADVAVRRRDPAAARGWIAEAEALARDLPAAVRADLAILHAEVAILEGDGARAIAAIEGLDPAARRADPLIHARALVIEARARLATLPVDARCAARLAITAIRVAREATLPEPLGQAIAALRAARSRSARLPRPARAVAPPRADPSTDPPAAASWAWIADLAAGAPVAEAATALARILAQENGAERAFVAAASSDGSISWAFGVDLDGLPIASPDQRIDPDLVRAALGRDGPVYLGDIATIGGRGSRLAIAGRGPRRGHGLRAILVLEHRFVPFAFDRVPAALSAMWAALGGILVRLEDRPEVGADHTGGDVNIGSTQDTASTSTSTDLTTAVPVSESTRTFSEILGQSPALRRALGRLDSAIDGDLPVLIIGETGTGKDLFARAIHEHGRRARRPIIPVNCGAIPDALFEAELFGHARGSFTGADRARPGLFARAEGGTLFLDEIGELPIQRQAALLRALQERRYRPVGSDDEVPFDVRIVAATNRDLERAVAERTFRQDLLYRLNAVEIRVPSLRERAKDIPDLVRAFLAREGSTAAFSREAMAALLAHAWPGNVRELEHVAQRLAQSFRGGIIEIAHLPRRIRGALAGRAAPRLAASRAAPRPRTPASEREEVARALSANGGNISRAAAALGLSRQGLKKRMVRLGMRAPSAGADRRAGSAAEEVS
ncbi:MAG: sigma 54-interacting transcriptional regulator [Minicystis sp.]